MFGLKQAGVELNRKVLADMAVNDAEGFCNTGRACKEQDQQSNNAPEAKSRSFSLPGHFLYPKEYERQRGNVCGSV